MHVLCCCLKTIFCQCCNQNQTQENLPQPKLYSKFQPLKFLKFFLHKHSPIRKSEKVAKDFSSQMLPPGFFMVHDSTTGCEDNEAATNQIKLWKHWWNQYKGSLSSISFLTYIPDTDAVTYPHCCGRSENSKILKVVLVFITFAQKFCSRCERQNFN